LSTDFEVHRNWLAITHSLPLEKWYYENTSEWTLDYPPFFAYFEYALSIPAKYIDKEMLKIDNLNYRSVQTVYYQRSSVIITELVLIFSLFKILAKVQNVKKKESLFSIFDARCFLTFQFACNFGLVIIDNIHFQYNGFLFGIMMLSIYFLNEANSVIKKVKRLVTIGIFTIVPFILSFGPFIHHIPQLISRLFPFKRGLSHAYWAPNVWAIYNFSDKILSLLFQVQSKSSLTSGLIKDAEHTTLPSISPKITFLFSLIFMLIPIASILRRSSRKELLVKLIVLCAFSSFLFGWHVHEKAILMILIPLSLLAVNNRKFASVYFFISTIAYYSLFPLLFKNFEYPIKVILFIISVLYNYESLKYQYSKKFKINKIELVYLSLIIILELYNSILHFVLSFDKKLPYLPLMITSVYCSIGIIYSWLKFLIFSCDA
ncbi:dolichyl glycosyltransferase, partial [Brachionus plicatilis]